MNETCEGEQRSFVPNGWVKLYSPRGPQVTLPVTVERCDYAAMLANVHAMLDAGWLVVAPGLEEGEEKEEMGWVLRKEIERDGETTPVIAVYPSSEQLTWPRLKIYLNHASDVAAFEYASRLTLSKLPLYPGQDSPERGANTQTDKFIIKAPKPFGLIWKKNPKYNPDEPDPKKRKPARLFVRWQDQAPPQKPEPDQGKQDNAVVDRWLKWLQSYPALEAFNDSMNELSQLDPATKRVVWTLVQEHASKQRWVLDRETKRWLIPEPEAADVF